MGPAHFKVLGLARPGEMSPITYRALPLQHLGREGWSLLVSSQRSAQAATSSHRGDSGDPDAPAICLGRMSFLPGLDCLLPGAASRSEDAGSAMLGSLCPSVLHAHLQPQAPVEGLALLMVVIQALLSPWTKRSL